MTSWTLCFVKSVTFPAYRFFFTFRGVESAKETVIVDIYEGFLIYGMNSQKIDFLSDELGFQNIYVNFLIHNIFKDTVFAYNSCPNFCFSHSFSTPGLSSTDLNFPTFTPTVSLTVDYNCRYLLGHTFFLTDRTFYENIFGQ